MKYANLHEESTLPTSTLMGQGTEVGVTLHKVYFFYKLNEMSRSAQKVMFLTSTPMG